jgi:hypothetical protein
MINITDPMERSLYQAELELLMTRLQAIAAKRFRPIIGRQWLNAAKSVQQGAFDINQSVNSERRRLLVALKNHYRRVAKIANRRVLKAVEADKSILAPQLKDQDSEFWNEMERWMQVEAAKKITLINESTKRSIARVLKLGISEGESFLLLAKRIRRTGLILTPNRAKLIARNETHTALVKSMDSSIKSTRIKMEREWVSARDDRTRTRSRGDTFEHFVAFPAGPDGERVSQEGSFMMTGEPLRFPGDPKGSGANTILCRCVVLYHTVNRTRVRQ